MHNAKGQVIYVGKAINLSNRVRSYFHAAAQENSKTRRLVADIVDIEWIVTDSEVEALILEANLIKHYRPYYNIKLKDDKHYPYLKITHEAFPKVFITHQMERDGSRYFGPYTSTGALRDTLDLLRRIFPFRTCDRVITGRDPRPCLYYDLKLCLGPCIGAASEAEYNGALAQLARFLEGHTEDVTQDLERRIREAAEKLEFERAAALRDRLVTLRQVMSRQKVVSTAALNQDVIALARDDGNACVEIFFVRNGKLLGREFFVMEGGQYADDQEMMAAFLQQFYSEAAWVPPEILLPEQITEAAVLQEWLRNKRGDAVYLQVPREGPGRELMDMAATNAVETLRTLKAQWAMDRERSERAIAELQETLGLPRPPVRMECYDISTTQGVEVVASLVVFEHGMPRKSDYRRFIIRSVEGQNDFASMKEVLTRRLDRWRRVDSGELKGVRGNQMWGMLPDLLIVDGGKGQLGVAVEVLAEFGLTEKLPVIGLAKQEEEVFAPGRLTSYRLPYSAPGLLLLRAIRDEAHRFAVTFHRQRREKRGMKSALDAIPGVGPARRKALIQAFGSVAGIRKAGIEDLAKTPGVPRKLAEEIYRYFREENADDSSATE